MSYKQEAIDLKTQAKEKEQDLALCQICEINPTDLENIPSSFFKDHQLLQVMSPVSVATLVFLQTLDKRL